MSTPNLDCTNFDMDYQKQHHCALVSHGDGAAALYLSPKTPNPQLLFELVCQKYGTLIPIHHVQADQIDTFLSLRQPESSSFSINTPIESEGEDLNDLIEELPQYTQLDTQDDAPMKRLLSALFHKAKQLKASDIHIEPYQHNTVIRIRVLGQLTQITSIANNLHNALISRLKILASLDISERRLPQDGRLRVDLQGSAVDLRISIIPSTFAERAVIRILDKSAVSLDLGALRMPPSIFQPFTQDISKPHGLLLVTGPTGSGKTTTLYSALEALDKDHLNIMTVEDPPEYELFGIGQIQVNPKIGLTFDAALRSILRQDPDVIMIGEIRDTVTAQIAVQAALTGHLVLATVHTNDAPSAPARLIDMGVEPFLLSSALLGVLAQRLVRLYCPSCMGARCAQCSHTGYSQRQGIYEYLRISSAISTLIHEQASGGALLEQARKEHYKTLFENAQQLIDAGLTSALEVQKACFATGVD